MPPTINSQNEAWVLHREDFNTTQDGHCNLYALLDCFSGHCFCYKISKDLPTSFELKNLISEAKEKAKTLPQKFLILKKDPSAETLEKIVQELHCQFLSLPQKDLNPYIKDFRDSMRSFKKDEKSSKYSIISDEEQEEIDLFMPSPYDFCSCASGQKFKFCCQKGFKEIIFAMAAAQEGKLEEALFHMNEAELKIGRTAEIVTRLAILWSFFDKKKSDEFLNEAQALNPNHPRLNYLLGIEAKKKNNFLEAISFYQKAIEFYPKEDRYHLNETYNNLANAFYYLNKYQEAKDAWEKALTYFPTDKISKNNLLDFIYNNPLVPDDIQTLSPFMKRFFKKI